MALDQDQVNAAQNVQFSSSADVNRFFQDAVNSHFVDWFRTACGGKAAWQARTLESSDQVKARFNQLWDNRPLIFPGQPANLLHFTAVMTAILVETGSQLLPIAELCGTQTYPGLVYPFDAIPGLKQSYNTCASNKPAGELFFNDPDFWDAHGSLASGDLVRQMPELRDQWNGAVYPQQQFNPSLDPVHSAFIQQADFFKFRGRGFIQMTWRANYKKVVQFVQGYQGSSAIVNQYKATWSGMDPDCVCTRSTNADWDALFQAADLVIATRAIGIHNESSGDYLNLTPDSTVLSGVGPGSFYHVGLRINGGSAYAAAFRDRASQMLNTLAYTGDKSNTQAQSA